MKASVPRVHLHVTLAGRVQGVYLRKTIASFARSLNILGTVTNLDEGKVSIDMYASLASSKAFLDLCKRGSLFSKVESMEIKQLPENSPIPSSFTIVKQHSFVYDQVLSIKNLIIYTINHASTHRHHS